MKRIQVFIDGEEVLKGECSSFEFEAGTRLQRVGPNMTARVPDGTGDLKAKFVKLEKTAFRTETVNS